MQRSFVIALMLLGFPDVAHAQPTEAEQLFEQAVRLRQAGNLEEACEIFERSYALVREPGTGLNLGECEERRHHRVEAWHIYQDALAKFDRLGNAAGARAAREHVTAVAAQLGTIVIGVPNPKLEGLSIRINDRPVDPAAEIREVVEPGDVSIVATATSRTSFERSRAVAAGETMVVELKFQRTRVEAPELRSERRRSRVYLALGLGATAAVAGVAGIVLGVKAHGDYDTAQKLPSCQPRMEPPRCDEPGFSAVKDAQSLANIGTGIGVAAGGLAVASIIIYVTAPRDAITITPHATAGSVGLSVSCTF